MERLNSSSLVLPHFLSQRVQSNTLDKGDKMIHFHWLYPVILVYMIILLWSASVHYLYINPIQVIRGGNHSEGTKRTKQPFKYLFYLQTESQGGLDATNIAATKDPTKAISRDLASGLLAPYTALNDTQMEDLKDFHNASNSTTTPFEATKNSGYCRMPPASLEGSLKVTLKVPPALEDISRIHPDLELGGHYKPPGCKSKDKVAIIVPYRDREEHLRLLMYNIHPVLKRQMLEYNIFVIEQSNPEPFNRAMLLNVGFVECLKWGHYDCFIFHDVDLIPENDRNLYNCPTQPRHMSVAVDTMNYTLPYGTIFGGVSALRTEHVLLVNGFSNEYWMWGAEDDDMASRLFHHGLNITRPPSHVARYKSLKHKQQKLDDKRFNLLRTGTERFDTDGLVNLNYTVEGIILNKLFTLMRVKLFRVGSA